MKKSSSRCLYKKKICVCVHNNVCTFTLASCSSLVSRGNEAEASRAVSGHGGFVQGDDLVAEAQRAVQSSTQFLYHPQDPDSCHLLNHSCRGVQLTEDNLKRNKEILLIHWPQIFCTASTPSATDEQMNPYLLGLVGTARSL